MMHDLDFHNTDATMTYKQPNNRESDSQVLNFTQLLGFALKLCNNNNPDSNSTQNSSQEGQNKIDAAIGSLFENRKNIFDAFVVQTRMAVEKCKVEMDTLLTEARFGIKNLYAGYDNLVASIEERKPVFDEFLQTTIDHHQQIKTEIEEQRRLIELANAKIATA